MMQKEKVKIDDIIRAINHALDMGRNRLQWYKVTGDENHMKECKEWNLIASMYMNKLIMEQKNETCES
jgi:hypothetical protein